MSINWSAVWTFVRPILREALVAFLMALLALLGYDQVVPSRFARMERAAQMKALGVANVEVSRRHDGTSPPAPLRSGEGRKRDKEDE